MTIPGNVTALLVLVAVVIACTGYAAGRLHQWYRTDEDRDEAYREGYDTATRSTFSMAARIIGPRRERSAARGSATVHAPAWRPGPAPATAAGSAAGPAGPDTWCPAKPSGLVGGSPAESAGRAAETAAGPSPDLPFPAPPPASASAPP
ncbi:MAG TPA: hypothetical protein VFH03_13050, partial [Actinoplanes sp.]|nr:hypothetical protein [Actinoplanes sp.]